MDKRKAAHIQATASSPTPDVDDRARKRRKQSTVQQNGSDCTGKSAQALGQGLLDAIMNHQERNRHIRQHFEKLPNQADYPDYYQKIKNPISLHEIQTKLNNNHYATLQDVEADLLLMCQNAATYNKPKSQVHSDSIRVKNVIDAYMVEVSKSKEAKKEAENTPAGRAIRGRGTQTLQQAMMGVVEDMMALVDEAGEPVAHYFLNLPSKKLYGEYFRIIKQPISLNMIKKKVTQGEYTRWVDFENAVALIKKNAEEFNDEGSDIVKDARKLNTYFVKRLAEGKAKVGDAPSATNGAPSGIKLRINVGGHRAQSPQKSHAQETSGPKIRLNVGKTAAAQQTPKVRAPSSSPAAPSVSPITNGNSASSSPSKQTSNGNVSPKKAPSPPTPTPVVLPPPVVPVAAPTPTVPVAATSLPVGGLAPIPVRITRSRTPEKPELGRSGSPHNETITLRANSMTRTPRSQQMSPPAPGSMPPPPQRLSTTPAPQSPTPLNVPVPAPPTHRLGSYDEPKYRAEGKDALSALITNLRVTSVSATSGEVKYTRDFSPDNHKLTSQFFIHLPADCQAIVITPTLSTGLSGRQHKFNVEHRVNNNAAKQIPVWNTQLKKKEELAYEVRLNPGAVNTIDCAAIAAARSGMVNGSGGGGSPAGMWELERFRLFVSLLPN
ncbi:Bromodomain-containing protein [Morchella conica CCBAS932]|uniref:Bromodomain-containing protein n=1 Tax=Morchella conica CCBAS932 TaxID=1392247 RepID=A0A3N4L8K1_9PEZI|nr:Bromodomain-containing protein [Morchella conica CCBAS932]